MTKSPFIGYYEIGCCYSDQTDIKSNPGRVVFCWWDGSLLKEVVMTSCLRIHTSIPHNDNTCGLPACDQGKVLVVEMPCETLFLLCAFDVSWNDVKALVRGQLLTHGVFSTKDSHLTILIQESEDGWPSRGQRAYALADLRDHLDSPKVDLKIKP